MTDQRYGPVLPVWLTALADCTWTILHPTDRSSPSSPSSTRLPSRLEPDPEQHQQEQEDERMFLFPRTAQRAQTSHSAHAAQVTEANSIRLHAALRERKSAIQHLSARSAEIEQRMEELALEYAECDDSETPTEFLDLKRELDSIAADKQRAIAHETKLKRLLHGMEDEQLVMMLGEISDQQLAAGGPDLDTAVEKLDDYLDRLQEAGTALRDVDSRFLQDESADLDAEEENASEREALNERRRKMATGGATAQQRMAAYAARGAARQAATAAAASSPGGSNNTVAKYRQRAQARRASQARQAQLGLPVSTEQVHVQPVGTDYSLQLGVEEDADELEARRLADVLPTVPTRATSVGTGDTRQETGNPLTTL